MKNKPHFQDFLKIAPWVILLYVIAVRVYVFFQFRYFYLDEVNLVKNIEERNILELFNPLDYHQHSPVLFTQLSKVASFLPIQGEFSLRLLPFLFSVLSLLLFKFLLDHWKIRPGWQAMAIALLGTNVVFLEYGMAFKQYSADVLVFIASLLLFLKWRRNRIQNLLTSSIFTVFVFLSMPTIFMVAALLCYEIVNYEKGKPHYFLPPLLAFVCNYVFFLSPSTASDHLQEFHRNFFLAIPSSWENLVIMGDQAVMVFRGIFGKTTVALALAIIGFFMGIKFRKEGQIILFLLLFTCGASMIQKYSLLERLLLFTYPGIILWVVSGWQRISDVLPYKKLIAMTFFILCLIILCNNDRFSWNGSHIFQRKNIKICLDFIDEHGDKNFAISKHALPFISHYRPEILMISGTKIIHNLKTSPIDSTSMFIDMHTFGKEKKELEAKMKQKKGIEIVKGDNCSIYQFK